MSRPSKHREWRRNLVSFYHFTNQPDKLPLNWDFGERLFAEKLSKRLYWYRRGLTAQQQGDNDEALRCEQLAEQALPLDNQQTAGDGA